MSQPKYTNAQLTLIQELCLKHGLQPDQISFDGTEITPIFDYEAVCALSLKLTDIADISCRMLPPTSEPLPNGLGTLRSSNAECTVTLADGRTRTCVDSAHLGETAGGVRFVTPREADGLAQNRAVRRGIRSVGVNLYNAHRKFIETGEGTAGHLDHDPRTPIYAELHALATELDLIEYGDKAEYREYIAENYAGRTSAKDLDDVELQRMLIAFRSLARLRRSKQAA